MLTARLLQTMIIPLNCSVSVNTGPYVQVNYGSYAALSSRYETVPSATHSTSCPFPQLIGDQSRPKSYKGHLPVSLSSISSHNTLLSENRMTVVPTLDNTFGAAFIGDSISNL